MRPERDENAKRFEIYPNGDMCSRAWDATEFEKFGDRFGIYRGDLSGMYRKRELVVTLRRLYPGCRIRVRH